MDNKPLTPMPPKVLNTDDSIGMTFPEAIKELTLGSKIARMSWKPNGSYGLLKDGNVQIFLNGIFHNWIINDGDLLGTDWVVVTDVN